MYENIRGAVERLGACPLSLEEQARNYAVFEDLMKKGIRLDELVRSAGSERTDVDGEIFAIMEETVRNETDVKEAKKSVENIRAEIIGELCLRDGRYKTALEAYRQTVSSAYVRVKDGKPPRSSGQKPRESG